MIVSSKCISCPKCGKSLRISMTGEYVRCVDFNCKYVTSNECRKCQKGRYTIKIDNELNMNYFECKECNHIYDFK